MTKPSTFAADFETRTFGVEIETSGKGTRAVTFAIVDAMGDGWRAVDVGGYYQKWAAVAPDGRRWICMTDGSIEGLGTEVVSPILKGEADLALLREIATILTGLGVVSSAEMGCGIHVHVGVKDLSAKALGNLAKVVAKNDRMIRNAIAFASSRAQYCRPLSVERAETLAAASDSRETLAAAWYGVSVNEVSEASREHYHRSRYCGLNLHSVFFSGRNTAEFRYFNGTLDTEKLTAYVHLCVGLVNFAKSAKTVSTKDGKAYARGIKRAWYLFLHHQIGLSGDAYATTREVLTRSLPTSSNLSDLAA